MIFEPGWSGGGKGHPAALWAVGHSTMDNDWRHINRYDTSHGFAHKDVIHYNGEQEKQPLYFPDFNTAFTYAIQELKISWRWYRMAYEKEMGK